MKYVIPVIIILILITALKNGTDVFSVFLKGVENGMRTVVGIFPVILAITVSVYTMRASGLLNIIVDLISPITDFFKIPKEVLPLALIRPVSGGGALGVLADTLKEFHPDTKIGFIASVIMASSETTFYTLSVYFKNTRAKYTSHIIPAAVFGDIVALLTAVVLSTIIF